MRSISLLVLLALVLPGCTNAVSCWIVYAAPTGDVAIGTSEGRASTLTGVITQRKASPAETTGATPITFTGGVVSTRMTWTQFAAGEGVP